MACVTEEEHVTDDLTPRRRQILEAATTVLARLGSRGLTHRAVDREAGLAEGSTSAYFRSRDALQSALAQFVSAQLTADVEALGSTIAQRPGDHEHAVAATSGLFARWLEHPLLLNARLELTVVATRDDQLARGFLAWRGALVDLVDRLLTARAADPSSSLSPRAPSAESLVAALDGVLLAALLQPSDRRRAFARTGVDQLLGTLDATD